jgi:hypothetical protein
MGALGNFYHREYGGGNPDVFSALAAEEDNLLAVWPQCRVSEYCTWRLAVGGRGDVWSKAWSHTSPTRRPMARSPAAKRNGAF